MYIEKTAKTINIAIDEALKELNTTIDKIDYEILQEPSNGFFGIGKKLAKIKVAIQEEYKIEQSIPQNEIESEISQNSEPDKISEEGRKEKNINHNAPQIAKDFLSEIFFAMGIKAEMKIKINDKGGLKIDLNGEDIGVIIGKRGQTLDSLQYLTNLMVNKGSFDYMPIYIDIEDYRERRKQVLENLAINLSKKAQKIRKNVVLEPMNPYERRIIHAKLQNNTDVKTYSEGREPFRYVIISPR